MRVVEPWERAVADQGADANRQVTVEGASGADPLPGVVDGSVWDAGEPAIGQGFRRLVYAVLSALRRTPWQVLPTPFAGWSTGFDGRPGAAWRRMTDGTVALSGRLSGSIAGYIAGPLPPEARPIRDQTFVVAASGGASTARITIDRNGYVVLEAFGTGAGSWVDLSAVRLDLG